MLKLTIMKLVVEVMMMVVPQGCRMMVSFTFI